MNGFIIGENGCPRESAINLCDAHIRKMGIEGIQMLVQSALSNGAPADKMPLTKTTQRPHRGGYPHHPVTKWCGETQANYDWMMWHTYEIFKEYEIRFGKQHFGMSQINHIIDNPKHFIKHIPQGKQTPFARALNQSQGRNLDLLCREKYTDVEAYRLFYIREKSGFARWERGRPAPDWWPVEELK